MKHAKIAAHGLELVPLSLPRITWQQILSAAWTTVALGLIALAWVMLSVPLSTEAPPEDVLYVCDPPKGIIRTGIALGVNCRPWTEETGIEKGDPASVWLLGR